MRRHDLILLVNVQRRPVLRTAVLQGVRRRPGSLHLDPSSGSADPHDTHPAAHPCLHQSDAARAFLQQNQCVYGRGAQKYDRLGRVLRVHNRRLGGVLARQHQGTDPVRRQGDSGVGNRNHSLDLPLGQLADARRVLVCSVLEPFGQCSRLSTHTCLALSTAGHRSLHPGRTGAGYRGV